MKKIILAIFVCAFLSLGVAQAETFSLISSSFSINGTMSVVHTDSADFYNGNYSQNSSNPVFEELRYETFSLTGGASLNEVYALPVGLFGANPDFTKRVASAYADASTVITIRPDFSGLGSIYVQPTGNSTLLTRCVFLLSDAASGSLIAALYSQGDSIVDSWGAWTSYTTLTLPNWDPDRLYELSMTVRADAPASPAFGGEIGLGAIATNMQFSNVPEPTTILLLILGLMGLAGVRKKFKS